MPRRGGNKSALVMKVSDIRQLRTLLRELRKSGVQRFRCGDIELELGPDPAAREEAEEGREPRSLTGLPLHMGDVLPPEERS